MTSANGAPPIPPPPPLPFPLAEFDPDLIHRVLLTDPEDYPALTLHGEEEDDDDRAWSVAYDEEFLLDFGHGDDEAPQLPGTGGRKYYDAVAATVRLLYGGMVIRLRSPGAAGSEEGSGGGGGGGGGGGDGRRRPSLEQLRFHVLKLHSYLRDLISDRTDLHHLHGMLSDSDVREMDLPPPDLTNPDDDFDADLLAAAVPRLLRAARVLEMLEAEERVPTTAAWAVVAAEALRKCGPGSPRPRPPLPLGMADAAVLVVSSTEYLLLKATYALENLGNYSLATVLAPLIALHGPYYERADFERKFGPIDFGGQGRGGGAAVPAMRWFIGVMTPITRFWMERTVQQWCMGCSRKEAEVRKAELRASKELRVTVLQTRGWAAGLDPRSQFVPEVLHRDAKCLRDMTSLMVMSNQGSLLTRYACKMAGVGDMVLWSESSSTADIAECREGLVAVFKQATTDEALKRGLSREVVRLARGEHGSSGVQSSNPGVISLGTAVHPQSDKPLAIAHDVPLLPLIPPQQY